MSQTPLTQTRLATVVVHVESLGMGCPFSIRAAHAPVPVPLVGLLHHWPVQSPSIVQPVPHAPVEELQIAPAACPLQSLFALHMPQAPVFLQYGFSVGHVEVPDWPLSVVHPAQTLLLASHSGVVLVHALLFPLVHWTHVYTDILQTGGAPNDAQSPSLAHPVPPAGTHSWELAPQVAFTQSLPLAQGPEPSEYLQTPLLHCWFPRQSMSPVHPAPQAPVT